MTDREPASMSEASKPCVIWECIYDHGNGKFLGEASKAQRERAFAELRRLHAEVEALRAEVERITNNRDMWQQQCFNQAAAMDQMRLAARKEST